MFIIDKPKHVPGEPDHCFQVIVPTYSSFDEKIGAQVATIHVGMAAITLWTVKGVQVSDAPSTRTDDPRGVEDGYAYAEGHLGDRVIIENDEYGEVSVPPDMLMLIEAPM